MKTWIQFGEVVPGYSVPVLNEREVRAAAGILFFFAMISFLNAFLVGNFILTKLFVIVFFTDFFIRVLINPRFAPSMILGRMIVAHQTPEYVGAPQKHFAWAIGLALGVAMLWLLVLNDIRGPVNLVICFSCLLLLFFETAFGICLGCHLYQAITRKKAQLCPGGVCDVQPKAPIQQVSRAQTVTLVVFFAAIGLLVADYHHMKSGQSSLIGVSDTKPKKTLVMPSEETPLVETLQPEPTDRFECMVPDWAVAMGHEDRWKRNHCFD